MPTIEEMSIEEVDAYMAKLRDRRKILKKSGKANDRKIATLMRRRERLMERVHEIDESIEMLRREASLAPVAAPRRRGRRPKNAQIAMA